MNIVYIALGSNLGDRRNYLNRAINEIEKRIGKIISLSAFYETEPWGFVSQHPFLNAVLRVDTGLDAISVLNTTQTIEKELGRLTKSANVYQDRCIDIDLLFFNNDIFRDEHLVLPHPLLQERQFVLEPLVEIAPNLYHPVLHKTIQELWREFQRREYINKKRI